MSDIEWRALRSVTAREIISAFIRDGFVLHNQRGAHQRYRHADGRRGDRHLSSAWRYVRDRNAPLDDRNSGALVG